MGSMQMFTPIDMEVDLTLVQEIFNDVYQFPRIRWNDD